jgi:hypothetical protein
MRHPRSTEFIRSADRAFGHHKLGDVSVGWPGGDVLAPSGDEEAA